MRSFPAVASLAVVALLAAAEVCRAGEPLLEVQDLYEGAGNRIPNVVVAADGSVLAFARSGRLLRRSADRGKTFEPAREVGHDAGGSAIVDWNTGDVMVVESKRGFLWRSRDHGKSWQREIVVKPNPMGHGGAGNVPVQTRAESGVTLQFGKHKGPADHAGVQPPMNNDQEWWPYNYNTAIYSDDGGKDVATSDRCRAGPGGALAELSGSIYYNRARTMSVGHRRRSPGHNGVMWVDWQVTTDLFESTNRSTSAYRLKTEL